MLLKNSTFILLEYLQIWLNTLMDDCHVNNIKKFQKKTRVPISSKPKLRLNQSGKCSDFYFILTQNMSKYFFLNKWNCERIFSFLGVNQNWWPEGTGGGKGGFCYPTHLHHWTADCNHDQFILRWCLNDPMITSRHGESQQLGSCHSDPVIALSKY